MKAMLPAFWRFEHARIVKTGVKVGFQVIMIIKIAIFNDLKISIRPVAQ